MSIHLRTVGDHAVVLSGVGRLMNDPRYSSAAEAIGPPLDAGRRRWVIEVADVRDAGPPLLGVLMTLTRRIRQAGGEVVLDLLGERALASAGDPEPTLLDGAEVDA